MILRKIVHATSKVLAVVGAILVAAIMVMITFDVAARNLGIQTIRGTSEIAEVMLVGAAFLTLPYAMQVGGHVATSFVSDRLPPQLARWLEFVGMLVVLGVLIWFSYEAVLRAIASVSAGETRFGVREVAIWPGRVALAVGTVALTLEVVVRCVDLARGKKVEKESADDLPDRAYL